MTEFLYSPPETITWLLIGDTPIQNRKFINNTETNNNNKNCGFLSCTPHLLNKNPGYRNLHF